MSPTSFQTAPSRDISIKLKKYSFLTGWRWIRTTEAICSRFTVCPLWPLGNPSIISLIKFTILHWLLNVKPMIGLEPITCWLQISCSANWATSAYKKWDLQGSNLWPSACKADALPAELRSHILFMKISLHKRPRRDSNPWPPPWQGGALTNWATRPHVPWKLHTRYILILLLFFCVFNRFLNFRLRLSHRLRLVFVKSPGQTLDRLVTVSSIHYCTSTSALSTSSSSRGLTSF